MRSASKVVMLMREPAALGSKGKIQRNSDKSEPKIFECKLFFDTTSMRKAKRGLDSSCTENVARHRKTSFMMRDSSLTGFFTRAPK